MHSSKKRKVLEGKLAPPVHVADDLWDDEPVVTNSGRHRAVSRGGAPRADKVGVFEQQLAEAQAASSARLATEKAKVQSQVEARLHMAPVVHAQYDSMPLQGGAMRALVRVDTLSRTAYEAIRAGPPCKWLFMFDRCDAADISSALVKKTLDDAACNHLGTYAMHGLNTQVAVGWYGLGSGLCEAGCVEGYVPWMRVGQLRFVDTEKMASALVACAQRSEGEMPIPADVAEGLATAVDAVQRARNADGLPPSALASIVFISGGVAPDSAVACEGATAPPWRPAQVLEGQATIVSTISVGSHPRDDKFVQLAELTGGHCGAASNGLCLGSHFEAIVRPFHDSNRAFLIEVVDGGPKRRLCLGMLAKDDAERMVTLHIPEKCDAQHAVVGAQVSFVNDLCDGGEPLKTNVAFNFYESEQECIKHRIRNELCNG